MKNLDDLRASLFAALDGLSDPDKPLDIARAQAIADISQIIINTVKVEIAHMQVTRTGSSGFVPMRESLPGQAGGEKRETASGVETRTPTGCVHKIR